MTSLERVSPLNSTQYAKTFATFVKRSTEYDVQMKIAQKVITKRKLNEKPTSLLSIGAGRGHFEVRLVRELGLKLDYVYAVEPTPDHYEVLKCAMESIDVEYHIDTSYFDQNFQIYQQKVGPCGGVFDFILMSHCLYVFEDPCAVVVHASKFLKPGGSLLIYTHNDPDHIYNDLINRSDPEIFSPRKTIQDHSIIPSKIISTLHEMCPSLETDVVEDMSYLEVDDFVRKIENSETSDVVSFLLQGPYEKLSAKTRDFIYDKVKQCSDVINGKYWLRHPNAGVEVYYT